MDIRWITSRQQADSHEAVHGSRPGAILRIRSIVISIIVRLGVQSPGMANNDRDEMGASITDLDELHEFLQSEMVEAQQCYQGPADKKHSPAPDFEVGDQVFLKAKYLRSTRPSKKLSDKYLGPLTIIAKPGTHSFTL